LSDGITSSMVRDNLGWACRSGSPNYVKLVVEMTPIPSEDGMQVSPRPMSFCDSALVRPLDCSAKMSSTYAANLADSDCGASPPQQVLSDDSVQLPQLQGFACESRLVGTSAPSARSQVEADSILSQTGDRGMHESTREAPHGTSTPHLGPGAVAADDDAQEACRDSSQRSTRHTEPVPISEGVERILAELNEACRSKILALIIDQHQEVQLDLGKFWTRGARLHTSGGCRPCASFMWKTGCEDGQDCALCHIPHSARNRVRPNRVRRKHLYEFSLLTRGVFRRDGSEPLHVTVRRWAAEDLLFQELLNKNATSLLEAARSETSSTTSSQALALPFEAAASPAASSDASQADEASLEHAVG